MPEWQKILNLGSKKERKERNNTGTSTNLRPLSLSRLCCFPLHITCSTCLCCNWQVVINCCHQYNYSLSSATSYHFSVAGSNDVGTVGNCCDMTERTHNNKQYWQYLLFMFYVSDSSEGSVFSWKKGTTFAKDLSRTCLIFMYKNLKKTQNEERHISNEYYFLDMKFLWLYFCPCFVCYHHS